ncbi:MAG: putative nitrogen fixation protein NifT [Gammaproteobacteria bacterium]|jgi:nitrogen fixation protein NifT
MANVMIRKDPNGSLVFYLAKKDLEAHILAIEYDDAEGFGGELTLDDGSRYYVDPLTPAPKLPITVRARRL